MTEIEIRQAIADSGAKDIGGIMRYMKSNFEGRFDGKLTSQIARSHLQ
jgi:uncharacterized protein YqeY